MNQNSKTSSFLRAINKYAQQQSAEILREAEEFKKQEIEKATQEGLKDAYNLIQKEISFKKASIISEFSKKEQESRNELFKKRNEIVKDVFEKAQNKLKEFTTTEEYKSYIRKSANEIAGVFENNACVIYLNEKDADKAEIVRDVITNCDIQFDNSIAIGGIKGYCETLNILADDTLDSKLSLKHQWFCENSGLKVV